MGERVQVNPAVIAAVVAKKISEQIIEPQLKTVLVPSVRSAMTGTRHLGTQQKRVPGGEDYVIPISQSVLDELQDIVPGLVDATHLESIEGIVRESFKEVLEQLKTPQESPPSDC